MSLSDSSFGLKFVVSEYSLEVLFDNGMSINLGFGCFESDITYNELCNKISTSTTIQDFVYQFTQSSLEDLKNRKLNYTWINSNGESSFCISDNHFFFTGGHMEHGEFTFKVPITEQSKELLGTMLNDVLSIYVKQSSELHS